jgi:alpha-1,6-mannosyltransferase
MKRFSRILPIMAEDRQLAQSAVWQGAAVGGAVICTAATWLHYLLSGGLRLGEWPQTTALIVSKAVALIGLCTLGAVCAYVYRSAKVSDLRRILVCALVMHACLLPALPLFSTDLFTYLAYGELAARGMNPHLVGPIALGDSPLVPLANWPTTPSVYGPIADLLMSIAGHVGHWAGSPLWVAGIVYKLLIGVLDAVGVVLLFRMARRSNQDVLARGFALYALNPLVGWELLAQGHNDGLVVFFSIVFLRALDDENEYLAAIALTLGSLSKFVLAPILMLFLWVVARRNLGRALLLGGLVLLLAVALYAPTWSGEATTTTWMRMIRQTGATGAVRYTTSLTAVVSKLLHALHAPSAIDDASYNAFVWTSRAVVLACGVFFVVRLRDVRELGFASLVVFLAILSTATILAPWYITWMVPFAATQTESKWQNLTLGMTLLATLTHTVFGLWVVLAVAQILGLVALARWGWWNQSPVLAGASEVVTRK